MSALVGGAAVVRASPDAVIEHLCHRANVGGHVPREFGLVQAGSGGRVRQQRDQPTAHREVPLPVDIIKIGDPTCELRLPARVVGRTTAHNQRSSGSRWEGLKVI
jgi:hypothetical protein